MISSARPGARAWRMGPPSTLAEGLTPKIEPRCEGGVDVGRRGFRTGRRTVERGELMETSSCRMGREGGFGKVEGWDERSFPAWHVMESID